MNNYEVHQVVNDLKLGKCNWSLQTVILLSKKNNRKCLTNWLSLCKNDSFLDFYTEYNHKQLTSDTSLYVDATYYMLMVMEYGDLKLVQSLTTRYNHLHKADYIYLATIHNNYDIVQSMINKGVSINSRELCILEACENGCVDVFKILIDGIDTNFVSAMRTAVEYKHKDIVKLMIENEIKIYSNKIYPISPFYNGIQEVITMMADENIPLINRYFYWAAINGYLDVVELFIDDVSNIESKVLQMDNISWYPEIVDIITKKITSQKLIEIY